MAEIVYVPAPVHHGRVENFHRAHHRDSSMSRGMFNNLLAHLSTKSKAEVVGLAAAGYFGSRGLAQYMDQAGWLAKIGIESDNASYGRAAICGIVTYGLRNKQPVAAVGAGVATVQELVGPWFDKTIADFATGSGSANQLTSGGSNPPTS